MNQNNECEEVLHKSLTRIVVLLRRCPVAISLRVILRSLGALVLVLLVLSLVNATTIKAWWITADLCEYSRIVRHADCPLEAKERLLDRTEAIEDYVRHGGTVSLFRWRRCNHAVRDLLGMGLTTDNIALTERELRRVEKEIVEQQTGESLR